MSDKCGNCDCADRSQCTKDGNPYGFEAEMNKFDEMVKYGGENECKCNCASGSCACTNCGCGCH